eukprot:5144513-Amphidinium_carterae.2
MKIAEAATRRGAHHAGRVMLQDGADQSTQRKWMAARVAQYVSRNWRFHDRHIRGSYHIQSDGSRVGNPAKELEVSVLALADATSGCVGGPLPPQVETRSNDTPYPSHPEPCL